MNSTIILGGGCFWCIEAVFQRIKGVTKVVSGYAGGHVKNPTYKQVCSEETGHAEVVQVTFDSNMISPDEILDIFWQLHDPTTLNRQGNDVGTQYRSIILYQGEEQKQAALESKRKLEEKKIYPDPIVTEIVPLTEFYPAEDYHQNYFNQHPTQGYCRVVINPKLQKLGEKFQDKLVS